MRYWTLGEIRTKVKRDLDLEAEVFVQPAELNDYINQAIDEAEAEIHGIYEDYFLTDYRLETVAGTAKYVLPTDIYANKIRRVIFSDDQSKTYEISRIPESAKFEDIALTERYRSTEFYRYLLVNDIPGSPQIYFVPPMRAEDTGLNAEGLPRTRMWYIRNANYLENDTDICDIPEFVHFVIAYTKLRCLEKERDPGVAYWETQVEKQRRLMIDTLANMVPDASNHVEPDMTSYEEIS